MEQKFLQVAAVITRTIKRKLIAMKTIQNVLDIKKNQENQLDHKMTQFNLIINSAPRELLEFIFFLSIGYTAGLLGLI